MRYAGTTLLYRARVSETHGQTLVAHITYCNCPRTTPLPPSIQIAATSRAQINDYVAQCTAQAAHHLAFGSGRALEMQSAHGACIAVERDVDLSYFEQQAVSAEFLRAELASK